MGIEVKKSGWLVESVVSSQKQLLEDKNKKIQNEKLEQKDSLDRMVIENWVDKYLSQEVLDEYALSYVKNQKKPEEKRQSKKYETYFKKAQQELKPHLVDLLELKSKEGLLNEEFGEEKVKEQIFKTLRSDMHANRLLKIVMEHTEQEQNQAGEDLDNADKQLDLNKEFFKKYKKGIPYIDLRTGNEFRIVDFDPDTKEVEISIYQVDKYDVDNDARIFLDENDSSRELKKRMELEEFEDYFKNAFLDDFEKNEIGDTILNENNKPENKKKETFENERALNEAENKIISIFQGFVYDKTKHLKRFVWAGHKKNGGIMDDAACREMERSYLNDFFRTELHDLLKQKAQKIPEAFKNCLIEKIIDYFKVKFETKLEKETFKTV